MPHRAGYFALAYNWDHHCHDLLQAVKGRFKDILQGLGELGDERPRSARSLLEYYKKWHLNRDLYNVAVSEINKRQYVLDSLGYRGYGVNRDLYRALEALKAEYADGIRKLLKERFSEPIASLKKTIRLPQGRAGDMDSSYIIEALCRKLRFPPKDNLPVTSNPIKLDLGDYFRVMSEETSLPVNTAIFQRLFLELGSSSMTIMRGSMGYYSPLSPADLKILGNRNFIDLHREMFSSLHIFTDIGIDLLKRIHFVLSRGIDPNAGNFRDYDFSDRNGVTLDYGNFGRELGDLCHLLGETARSFHDLDDFIYNLSRAYYMFIGIHPFGDSNGRTARCFLNFLLLKKGIPPISFNDDLEVFSYPRYGGSMEDTHEYIKARIMKAVGTYLRERRKLESYGLLSSRIYNVSFDSGFHFRQADDSQMKIDVCFKAYIIDEDSPLSRQYIEECRVVLPYEHSLGGIVIYCGLSRDYGAEWEHVFCISEGIEAGETASDIPGIRVFDLGFIIELHGDWSRYDYFCCSVVSPETGRTFNNKGLNYCFRISGRMAV